MDAYPVSQRIRQDRLRLVLAGLDAFTAEELQDEQDALSQMLAALANGKDLRQEGLGLLLSAAE